MAQPPGFVVTNQESKFYRSRKVLYELQLAPRTWNKRIDEFLKEMEFDKYVSQYGVYVKKDTTKGVIILCLLR